MNATTISQILRLIEASEAAEEEALRPGNESTHGYPFAVGYQRSTLENIKQLLEREAAQ